jgi:integrase
MEQSAKTKFHPSTTPSIHHSPASSIPMTKWVSIGSGAYEERRNGRATGRYRARPRINGRRTWRELKDASDKKSARIAAASEWKPRGNTFATLSKLYLNAGCPTKRHNWLRGSDDFQADESRHITQLLAFYKHKTFEQCNGISAGQYFEHRTHGHVPGVLTRAVDKEIQTLVNVKAYACYCDQASYPVNDLKYTRPRFHKTKSQARDRMPESAEVIHQLTEAFLEKPESEVFAWLTWFAMFTGCRQSELLRLRLDARPREAGHVRLTEPFQVPEWRPIYRGTGYLCLGRRSKVRDGIHPKDGLNPECVLWPEFAEMLDCFRRWHKIRYPKNPWYFPGLVHDARVDDCSFNHALARETLRLKLPHITPHGLRSYFATKLHRDGWDDADIAAAIGDKTVAVVQNTYRDRRSGDRLSWLPKEGLPGWQVYAPKSAKIIKIR